MALCGLTCFPIGNSCAQVNQASEILHHMSADMASPDSLIITGDGFADDRLDADAEPSLKSVAIIQDDMVLIAYEVERLTNGWVAVYLPGAPDTCLGGVAYFTEDRIVPLDTDFASIAGCLKTLGRGSSKIISDTPQLRRNA